MDLISLVLYLDEKGNYDRVSCIDMDCALFECISQVMILKKHPVKCQQIN